MSPTAIPCVEVGALSQQICDPLVVSHNYCLCHSLERIICPAGLRKGGDEKVASNMVRNKMSKASRNDLGMSMISSFKDGWITRMRVRNSIELFKGVFKRIRPNHNKGQYNIGSGGDG